MDSYHSGLDNVSCTVDVPFCIFLQYYFFLAAKGCFSQTFDKKKVFTFNSGKFNFVIVNINPS